MKHLKIALCQLAPTGSLAGNQEKGIAACRRPKKYTILTDNSVREPFCRDDFPR